MGTWIGHIAPGVFFSLFALWWHVNNCLRYCKSLSYESNHRTKPNSERFQGATTYPCVCLGSRVLTRAPIESILKMLIVLIHFSIELITGYETQPRPHIIDENSHHTAMLFGFFLGSLVEILIHYKFPLPKRTTQVMGFLAFFIEGIMMVFHLHARSMIDGHIHKLLGLTIVFSTFSALGECFSPNNFWLIIARSYFVLTQGTWFIQAAFVLWPKTSNPLFIWDPESHRSVSLLTMSYAYHLAGNASILIIIYLLTYYFATPHLEADDTDEDNDETTSSYKLILNNNEEENCV